MRHQSDFTPYLKGFLQVGWTAECPLERDSNAQPFQILASPAPYGMFTLQRGASLPAQAGRLTLARLKLVH